MAELAVTCPACGSSVNIPIEAEAKTFICPQCSTESPIQESLDAFGTAMKDPLIGVVVSECEILEKVGEGGFGAVYKAFDRNLQRPVALKVMLQSLTSNLEFVQKFIREAVTAAQLNHPNIVAIHKVGRDEDRNLHFLIMEFLEGRTLSEVIEEKGELPLDESISIILQCADALAVAQDKNIIHRDIKPENIMIDKNGVVKITDFGLAKTLTTDMKSTKVVGTPHYMSPEQFEGKAVDGRTDIYSLGITFYYMLTQAKPYEGTNTVQIIYSILTQDPKPVSEMNPDIPEEVWRVIRRMIAKEVSERYSDFREVRRDLLSYQERSIASKVTCPSCDAVNVKGRKFCRECGASLLVKCPSCSHEEPAGTRHCGECGTNIDKHRQISENLVRGQKLRGFGDLKRAMAFYEEVLKIDPDHKEAEQATREIRLELEKIEERKSRIDELVKAGDTKLALQEVEGLLSEFPKVEDLKTYGQTVQRSLKLRAVDAHLMVAEKALDDGRLEDAIDAYDSALTVDPDRSDIRDKLDRLKGQISAFEENLAKAESALAEGRHMDALRAAKELLRVKPEHERASQIHEEAKAKVESIESVVREAKDCLDRKDFDEALSRLETAIEISPGDEGVLALIDQARRGRSAVEEKLTLIRRLLAENKADEAKRGAEELLADVPDHELATALKAEAQSTLEEQEREQALEALVAKGRELEKNGDYEEALAVYIEVLETDPDHEKAKNLRDKLESRLDEGRRLKRVAEEHLADGAFAQAALVLTQLRDIYPNDQELRKKAELASAKKETVEGALLRAADALRRKRFDLVLSAAEEVLSIAPKNGEAIAARNDAERGMAAIEKQLEEARELIDSELFDDALASLEKAVERGATDEQIQPVRDAAEDGKMMLLKSDATRSFVFKDYAAAIEKYEQILSVDKADDDAQKGIKMAKKAIVARGRESFLGKGAAAAVLIVALLVTQFVAVGSGEAEVVDVGPVAGNGGGGPGGTGGGPDGNGGTEPVEEPQPEPKPTINALMDIEMAAASDAAGWGTIRDTYDEYLAKHEGEPEFVEGREFAEKLVAAFDTPMSNHRERLGAFNEAGALAGGRGMSLNRKKVIREAMTATVEDWIRTINDSEGDNYAAAAKEYQNILDDPIFKELGLAEEASEVGAYLDFAKAMVGGVEAETKEGDLAGAYGEFGFAASVAGDDEKRRQAALERRESVKTKWIQVMRERVRAIGAGDLREEADRIYREVMGEGAKMAAVLKMDPEKLIEEILSSE